MHTIDKILAQLEICIKQDKYETIETDKVELKDFSGGVSAELYKSVGAFLNTGGGLIIIGIREKDKRYAFTGYNSQIEDALRELPKQFRNQQNQPLDLTLSFPTPELKDFMGGKVGVVYVEKLAEEQKYVFYKGEAYKRNLTGDDKLTPNEIESQNRLKIELENGRELRPVDTATLDDLDVDKLNDYIIRLNREVKVETLKADILSALSFLTRKKFVCADKPTLLGMLVCGRNIEDFLGAQSEVDGFVDSPIYVAENKQVLKDNILALMERSVSFVYQNIQVGVSQANGGMPLPEYPEKLIRETVNNALAHRDYQVDKFVNIIIKPNHSLEIRNPGSFRQEQQLTFNDPVQKIRVRRLIPIAKARNPRLADILKTFDRWEGRGIGLASLVNACLDNQIGVPYYLFHSVDDISLVIPKGKVLADHVILWLDSFSGYVRKKLNGRALSMEEQGVLSYFYQSELLNRLERYTILLTPDNNHFGVIATLADNGLIFRHPDSPMPYHVYLVDRVLTQSDFSSPLRDMFGTVYDDLSSDYQDVLQAIYQHNQYSTSPTISANRTASFLYLKKNAPAIDLDNFKRKVRYIFNRLEEQNFIVRQDGRKPEFVLNKF